MSEVRVPSAIETTGAIAALTLKRAMRGRAVWVGAIIAFLPVIFATLMSSRGGKSSQGAALEDIFVFELLLLAVLPAMFVASSIGEDIEDRTTTYLWSRPIPRTAIIVGKLVALVPIVCIMELASWTAAIRVGASASPTGNAILGLVAGVVGISAVAAALATLVPKHGMALTIVYMLFFDFPIGAMPASLRNLAVSHHVLTLVDPRDKGGDKVIALVWIGIVAVVWLAIALRRIRRLEA